jgi:hypothetical protein
MLTLFVTVGWTHSLIIGAQTILTAKPNRTEFWQNSGRSMCQLFCLTSYCVQYTVHLWIIVIFDFKSYLVCVVQSTTFFLQKTYLEQFSVFSVVICTVLKTENCSRYVFSNNATTHKIHKRVEHKHKTLNTMTMITNLDINVINSTTANPNDWHIRIWKLMAAAQSSQHATGVLFGRCCGDGTVCLDNFLPERKETKWRRNMDVHATNFY